MTVILCLLSSYSKDTGDPGEFCAGDQWSRGRFSLAEANGPAWGDPGGTVVVWLRWIINMALLASGDFSNDN